MQPKIIDADTGKELWRTTECAAHCGITPRTWASYHANKRTPAPVAMLDGRSALWLAEDIKRWHAARPGSPAQLRR
ncbi:hypothetical protein GWO60_06665 [Corynebacterium macginleyi]|mgnify:FL=1|uniref:hypothetical protein n=1 Tax=Corynebacterium macginleyi TaxID=38290 RepID=UPI00190B8E37|nr:hypothetical protein [Corynebacterium macginleyi]MBK4151020.1 hypothetical protein [Corynebacterium macginleyi]MBK4152843.1 hypothetical protein [Corynebacterium macginleyi]MBK4160797.1 hypothetical protein [Corynebacterium macginleyi]MBK4162626.1 hypothetical protein [Corynebacterium macginleyi]MBK4168283.1 hypothetical protein [Corynebacterium macginleyi]